MDINARGRNLIGAKETHIDNGCYLHDDCETCPFPDCILPTKMASRAIRSRIEAIKLNQEGYSIEQIAQELDKEIRLVQMWINKEKKSLLQGHTK